MQNRATILVVEDDLSLMQGIRDILEIQGYSVLTAGSGSEGIHAMRSAPFPPDLIMSDIMMPNMNGYEFFNEVRKEIRWTNIPFVFLTAKGERTDIRLGKSLGVDDYLVKPFEAEDLVVVVNSRLRRRLELEKVQETQVSTIKRNILTILNHEFRTPLTYIVAYADMLNRDADDLNPEELKTFLNGINAGANRLRRLVENFILLVDLDAGQAPFNWRKREFNDFALLLSQVAYHAQPSAEEKAIKIEVLSATNMPSVIGDSDYLIAALLRLVDNAIKFTDVPNTAIKLSAVVKEDYVCLNVIDQGRGIAREEQQQIFDVFYQINRQAYEDQGAGAGLPIVERITRMHGGLIDLESEVGKGSRFSICLPISRVPIAN